MGYVTMYELARLQSGGEKRVLELVQELSVAFADRIDGDLVVVSLGKQGASVLGRSDWPSSVRNSLGCYVKAFHVERGLRFAGLVRDDVRRAQRSVREVLVAPRR